MPFKKVGADDYVSPSGRHWTGAQVRLYHATKGFKKKPKQAAEALTHEALTPEAILQQEQAKVEEAWTAAARAASAIARRGASRAASGTRSLRRAAAPRRMRVPKAAGVDQRAQNYAAAQTRAKQRGIASAVPVPKKPKKGKKPPKPKPIRVKVPKAAYNKVNAFGSGRQRVIPR
jgi:hypothetical protein